MVGSFDTSYVGEFSIRAAMDLQSDQSGQGYLGTDVQPGWRIITSTGRLYRIDSVYSANFQEVSLSVTGIKGTSQPPNGVGMVFQYDGSKETIPVLPQNSSGLPSNLTAAILTHNAETASGIEAPNYGRIRYVNKAAGDNATAEPGNPLRPYVTAVAAVAAGGLEFGDVIHTYNSEYEYSEFGRINNPPNGLVYSFDNVEIYYEGGARNLLFNVDFGAREEDQKVDFQGDSSRYMLTIRGNLIARGIVVASIYVDEPNPVFYTGDTIPEVNVYIAAQEYSTTTQFAPFVFVNGSGPRGVSVNGKLQRGYPSAAPMLSTGFFSNLLNRVQSNRKFFFEIDELYLTDVGVNPGLYRGLANHLADNDYIGIRVNKVFAPIGRNVEGSAQGYYSRLASFARGGAFTNGEFFLSVGTIINPKRGSAKATQGAVDYSNVVFSLNTQGDNPRMVRINGDITGSRINVECDDCSVDDGFMIIDQPIATTANPANILLRGTIHSREHSAMKLAQSGPGINVAMSGQFSSEKAPVVSSALTAPAAGTSYTSLRGTYTTQSSSFPAITSNRPLIMSGAFLSRPKSSGGRPAIESNTASTLLQHNAVSYLGAGSILGPNFTATLLKTIQ